MRRAALLPALAVLAFPSALPAPALGAEPCPNEAARSQQGEAALALPDCRAYELVTPPYTNGQLVSPSGRISTDGSHLTGQSIGAFAGTVNEPAVGAAYDLVRSPAGWSASPLSLPASLGLLFHEVTSIQDLSPGFDTALFDDVGRFSEPSANAIFLSRPGGSAVEVGPEVPPAAIGSHAAEEGEGYMGYKGASSDFSHVLFAVFNSQVTIAGASLEAEERAMLWPGDRTVRGPSLYEYVGAGHTGTGSDLPALVGLDNAGHQLSQCGISLGAAGSAAGQSGVESYNAVSRGGEAVFFTAEPGGCHNEAGTETGAGPPVDQLFARLGPRPASATTVNVAASSGCGAFPSCNVTSPVSFAGASRDGSRVFFTESNVLYECELPGDGAVPPPAAAVVDPCPHLEALSVARGVEAADVLGVARVSEDGSHVYFVAAGVLSEAPNGLGDIAQPGRPNLYVYDAESEKTAFVATLAADADSADWQKLDSRPVQATPDGRFLLFSSSADLTPDDTSTAPQLFLYDARSGALVRVSVGQKSAAYPAGFNADGNTSEAALAPSFPTVNYALASEVSPAASSIGSRGSEPYVFFESPNGLTPRALDRQPLSSGPGYAHNVYEYHDGNVFLVSDGLDRHGDHEGSLVHLIGASPSGADVFFTTADQLVPQDTNTGSDVYDARIDGGFLAPGSPGCAGEACQGRLAPAPSRSPAATAAFSGPGNLAPAPRRCPRGRRAIKRNGRTRCVKRRHRHHRRRHRRARAGRRAIR